MNRIIITLASIFAVLLATLNFGLKADLIPVTVVMGGEYTLQPGQTIHGDLAAVFARVTIPDGATINGSVFSLSSDVDIYGVVTNSVRAVESAVQVRDTGHVNGQVNDKGLLHWVVLLPNITHLP